MYGRALIRSLEYSRDSKLSRIYGMREKKPLVLLSSETVWNHLLYLQEKIGDDYVMPNEVGLYAAFHT